jgi:uncharacterized protein YjeT (DUF2065 family)
MRDFGAALGLVFALEGLLMLAFPGALAAAMAELPQRPPERLRRTGLIAALTGVLIIWVVRRGFL